MAAPNIINVTNIKGKCNVANVTTVFSNLVVNEASSGKVYKVNTLYVTNVLTQTSNVNIGLVRSGYSYAIVNTSLIPSGTTLDVISKPLYMEEGDYIQINAEANNYIHAVCSYEELS